MKDNVVPKFISHIRKNPDGEIAACQSNEEHCLGVAILARQFASEFGMGDWGCALGLLHDKGKEKKEFQDYIRDVNGMSGYKGWTPRGKAHAYYVVNDRAQYDEKIGLRLDNHWMNEILTI